MQVLGHCGLCVSRGLFQARTDFLLTRASMGAFRHAASCLHLLRVTASGTFINRPPVRQLLRVSGKLQTHVVSFSLAGGLSTVPFIQQAENLSHESLIRRASCMVTDSSNTYLSQTTMALVDALTLYTKALHTLIALQKRYLASIGKLTPAEEDSIWQVIIGQRVEVGERLDDCKRFESNWINAVNICELSSEAAYNSGAEHASNALKSSMKAAQSKVEEMKVLQAAAQKSLAELKAEEIQRMAEYASSINLQDLEDVPEAYLRED